MHAHSTPLPPLSRALINPFSLLLLVLSADAPPGVEPLPAGLPAHPPPRTAIQRCTGGLAPLLAGATGGCLPRQVCTYVHIYYRVVCVFFLIGPIRCVL